MSRLFFFTTGKKFTNIFCKQFRQFKNNFGGKRKLLKFFFLVGQKFSNFPCIIFSSQLDEKKSSVITQTVRPWWHIHICCCQKKITFYFLLYMIHILWVCSNLPFCPYKLKKGKVVLVYLLARLKFADSGVFLLSPEFW